jgi:peptide/nickel transport system substrate-binding protein
MFLDTMARTDCGMTAIVNKASIKIDGSWDHPIGTGPYKFVDWKRGRGVTLARFESYVSPPGADFDGYVGLKAPHVDEIEFQVVPDPATVKLALSTKSIDIAQALSSDAKELKADPNLVVLSIPDSSKNVLLFQTKDPLLGDQKFRRAIAAALDYEQLVDVAGDGLSRPNNSAIFPGSVYFDDVQRGRISARHKNCCGRAVTKAKRSSSSPTNARPCRAFRSQWSRKRCSRRSVSTSRSKFSNGPLS